MSDQVRKTTDDFNLTDEELRRLIGLFAPIYSIATPEELALLERLALEKDRRGA